MKVNQDYFGFASLRSGIGLKKKKKKKKKKIAIELTDQMQLETTASDLVTCTRRVFVLFRVFY